MLLLTLAVPSWVPDWSAAQGNAPKRLWYGDYDAAAGSDAKSGPWTSWDTISFYGLHLGEVRATGTTCSLDEEVDILPTILRWRDMIEGFHNTAYPLGGTYLHAYMHTITADWHALNRPGATRKYPEVGINNLRANSSDPDFAMRAKSFIFSIYGFARGRNFFISDAGLLGDLICIMHGGQPVATIHWAMLCTWNHVWRCYPRKERPFARICSPIKPSTTHACFSGGTTEVPVP